MANLVFEFPYSGYPTSEIPFLTYNPTGLTPYRASSLENSIGDQSSVYHIPDSRQIFQNLSNDVIVYKIPDNMSLKTLLRQLGVNVDSLQQASPSGDHFISTSLPTTYIPASFPRGRRRRLICREVSDSEDDSSSDSLSRHNRHRSQSSRNKFDQSPARVHNLLNNAWTTAVDATRSSPQQQNAPSPPPPQDQRNAVANVWNQAATATKNKPNFLSSFFNKLKSGNTNTSLPPQQQGNAALQNFAAATNLSGGGNQPNSPVANVFNAAQRGSPPPAPYGAPPPQSSVGSVWNHMIAGPRPPPPQSYYPPQPSVGSVWNQMSAGPRPPPQQTYYPPQSSVGSMWNQMTAGPRPPPPQSYYPPQPSVGSAWNQMSAGPRPPPQQSYYPPQAPMGSMWNQMSAAAAPSPPYGASPPSGTQQGNPSASTNILSTLFSRPRQ
ncbi:unnamed protein product [Adineta ricciae]|uniref:Uncharacterized protein n=1 Tax=Adineta ricciae TaxID=249248 RepID=A0A814JFY9_ADIRI|nr:unnamed protein product [Adineta ricciae]CAF1036390.1 unnamed protein product [Adineta ricciae]